MPTEGVARKLAAVVAADVAEYSRLMRADEAGTLAALSGHGAAVGELIGQRRGRIVNTAGDSILAEFGSVLDAVECAVEIQQVMRARNADEADDRKMLFRIGVNVTDVMTKDDDIFGDGVNLAARIQALATPGAVCVSRSVRDHLRDRSPFVFDDLGEHSVKNITRPIRVFAVRFEGAPAPARICEAVAAEAIKTVAPKEIELAFWESIKGSIQASDYRAYLEQYPEGSFAALAKTRIANLATTGELERGNDATSDQTNVEIVFWESVKDSHNPDMVRAYLERYPDGNFVPLARAKLDELGG